MRYLRPFQRLALIGLLVLGSPMTEAWAEIVMKILVVNPSETESKEFTIHSALPPEVKAEDVLDTDGLRVDYDSRAGAYVLMGTVILKPKQSLTKHIVLEDVWVVPEERFATVQQEIEAILAKLAGTAYESQGKLLGDSFGRRLADIEASQEQPAVSPDQHISLYRDNLKSLQALDADLVSLRQLMVMAALQPADEAVLTGSGAGAALSGTGPDRGGLSILTTWRLIFFILGLLGFVSLSFFLVWHRQLRVQLAKQAAHEQAAATAEDLFTNGNGTSLSDAPTSVQPRIQPKSPLAP